MPFIDIVGARTDDGGQWLRQTAGELRARPELGKMRIAFARSARKLGADLVELTDAERERLRERAAPADEAVAVGWRLRDHGRAALVDVVFGELGATQQLEMYATMLRRGELGEQESLLRMVPLLSGRERFVDLAIDACRTNAEDVFAAIACENPFPAACFPDHNFNQLVLKAVFIGLDVTRIEGLGRRVTPELVRMAEDFASERRAAGRPVPDAVGIIAARLEEKS